MIEIKLRRFEEEKASKYTSKHHYDVSTHGLTVEEITENYASVSTHPSPDNRAATLGKLGEDMMKLNPTLKKAPVAPVEIITNADQLM